MTVFHYGHDMKPGDHPRLRSLEIERQGGNRKDGVEYKGMIKFDTPSGTVEICLKPEQCAAMFAIVADGVIETAKQVATLLTEEMKAGLAQSHPLHIK